MAESMYESSGSRCIERLPHEVVADKNCMIRQEAVQTDVNFCIVRTTTFCSGTGQSK